MASGWTHHFMANKRGKSGTRTDFIFLGSRIIVHSDYSQELKRHLLLGRKAMTNLGCILKGKDITSPTKVYIVKAMVFPAVMYGCECWTIGKAECQRIDVFELWCWRRLENPLDFREIKQVNHKGNQPWIFTGRNDVKVETPILWLPNVKSQFTGKDPDDGENWGQEEKRVTEDEMVGWQSPTQWIWTWANARKQWQTRKPGVLQPMGLERVGHSLATEQQRRTDCFSRDGMAHRA